MSIPHGPCDSGSWTRVSMIYPSRLIVVSNWKMSDKMRRLECEHSNCESCLQWRCAKYFEYEIDEMKKLGVRPGLKLYTSNFDQMTQSIDVLLGTIFGRISWNFSLNRIGFKAINLYSDWGSRKYYADAIEAYALCSNWLSFNKWLQNWFLKTIRPEAIDPELCLQVGTTSFAVRNQNSFEDLLVLGYYPPVNATPGLKWVEENWNGKMSAI